MNKLGKYLIRRTLGRGAMGVVYEGFDPVIERTVAIKTILPSQLDGAQYAEVMARFRREAQAAGRLNHQGIVAIYEYGEGVPEHIAEDDVTMLEPSGALQAPERVAYIAMEFVRGRELRDFFERGERFKPGDVARIMGEILDALDHAHAHGVVHRDMKPANLIVLENGQVKIADFGIARVEASELTQTGAVLGTPSYMSPEQFMGHPVDGRSDLFSCGVILYQLLTGEKPFTGESTTTIMYKVLREAPVPPSQLNPSLSPRLDAVLHKALAKNPNERFQSGGEFADAIRSAIAEVRSPSPQPVSWPGSPAPAQSTETRAPAFRGVTASSGAGAPKSAVTYAAVVACTLAVVAGAYAVFGGHRDTSPPLTSTAASGATATVTARSQPVATPPVATAAAPASEPGTLVISALGLVDPADARFKGDLGAAQAEARNEAQRRVVEKAIALYVDAKSIDGNRGLIEQKLLANSGAFIRAVVQEGAASAGKGGLIEMPTRAVVNLREVQKSLNQLSRDERVDFIRNQGDPRISIRIDIGHAGGDAIGRGRSELAENVVKDRFKSFGFRVWSGEGDNPGAAAAQGGQAPQSADFAVKGEVRLKSMSTKLPASGLTVTKTAITSWTLKAIETSTGEEVYLSTKLPSGQSWASEDAARGRRVLAQLLPAAFQFPHTEDRADLHRPSRRWRCPAAARVARHARGARRPAGGRARTVPVATA
jgi:serine/threonine-protein kinase